MYYYVSVFQILTQASSFVRPNPGPRPVFTYEMTDDQIARKGMNETEYVEYVEAVDNTKTVCAESKGLKVE